MPDTPESLLSAPITSEYRPSMYWSYYLSMRRRAPPFTLMAAMEMMTDPRITLGLWLIKGPILSKTRFFVDCENAEVKEFLKTQITRFWRHSIIKALKAVEWGFSCAEALYRVQDGQIHFDQLKDLHPMDCRAITQNGKLVGASVRNVPNPKGRSKVTLEGGRAFWTVHSREIHQWYGRSRLFGAYLPWLELWSEGGSRDARRLFFHKYAFQGPRGYAPTQMVTLENGQQVSARDLLRENLEKERAGAIAVYPNSMNAQGTQYQYDIRDPVTQAPPEGLMQYIADLRTEILEGMGLPPEVIQTEGVGAYSGRAIPMDGFYSILQEIVNTQAADLSDQILKTLVKVNFGEVPFEIIPFGLIFAPSTPSDKKEEAAPDQSTDNGGAFSMPVVEEPPKWYRPKHHKTVSPVAVVA